jgi:hypothetical protein
MRSNVKAKIEEIIRTMTRVGCSVLRSAASSVLVGANILYLWNTKNWKYFAQIIA